MNDKQLSIWLPVWAQKGMDYLEKCALPSLMLPGNLPALGLEKIYVFHIGVNHEKDHAERIINEGLPGLPIEIHHFLTPHATDPIHGLRELIPFCIQRGTRCLTVAPDTIFGNWSVSNIFRYAEGKPVTVLAAHVRVNENLWNSQCTLWRHWPHNRDFVRNAFAIGAVDVCDVTKDNVNHFGGIAWTKISDDTRLMLHHLPTPFLMWFEPADIAWWQSRTTYGDIDHTWPSFLLAGRRMRVIGSTDVFFAIELESAERSGQLKPEPGSAGREGYYKNNPHNDACGSFLIEVRS